MKLSNGTQNKSEEKYRALFNCMVEGFALHEIITNDQGQPVDYRFIEVNPAFERLTGKRKEDILGKTLLEVFPESEKVWIERYGRVALTGNPESFTEYSKGTGRWYDVSAYSPASRQFACIFIDSTAARGLEDQLRQLQKMESVESLAGGVAHDFNNILTAIMGAGTMLQMRLDGDTELEPFVRQILNSSERAAQLTHNLLSFSRNLTIKPLPVDANTIVCNLHEYLERNIAENLTLEVVCSSEPLPVCVDRGQIEQVLLILVANARDAMPAGGVLRLETAFVDSHDYGQELDGCQPGSYARIALTDTGAGMDSETCMRIFDPFFTTKHIGYGVGLGLSMASGIVKQHAGAIKVQSQTGVGTVFRIYLPLWGQAVD